MKKVKVIFTELIPILIFVLIFMSIIAYLSEYFKSVSKKNEIVVADGYTIEAYDVLLDVHEDNKVDVTESITVYFESSFKHGIYKYTPTWLEYTGMNGETIKRKANILNYRAENESYTIDTIKKKERIKIGSADEYVPAGEKTYVIKYVYDMGKDPFKGFDEFIFHVFGDYWGTEINNPTIKVIMPKSIEGYNINFYTDKYRNNNVNDAVHYEVIDNVLYAEFDSDLYYEPLTKSLTLDIELPDNYFVGGSNNYGIYSLLLIMLIFILLIWTIIDWFKYGKDYAKKAQTVEFYPPDNLNPAEIGYIDNERQQTKSLTIALIIELASKGYIKINELEDKKIEIINLYNKPNAPTEVNLNRVIEVKKLKDVDNSISTHASSLMLHMFKKDNVGVVDNIEMFMEVKDELISNGYIEVISDNEKEIEDKRLEYDKLLNIYNKDFKVYSDNIAKLPQLSSMEQIVYDNLFEYDNDIILSEHKTFYHTFNDIKKSLDDNLKYKVRDKKAEGKVKYVLIRTIIMVIALVLSYSVIEDLNPNYSLLYGLGGLSIFVNTFFMFIMYRKTEYGETISARVKGFKQFLEVAEKEQLERLVSENPQYFYDILPYTYVLGISKKWISKFEDIPIPEADMGSFDFGNDASYYSIYDNIYFPASTGSSSSSGCSSCGGGCSSCGGGCSSCGGGGSW